MNKFYRCLCNALRVYRLEFQKDVLRACLPFSGLFSFVQRFFSGSIPVVDTWGRTLHVVVHIFLCFITRNRSFAFRSSMVFFLLISEFCAPERIHAQLYLAQGRAITDYVGGFKPDTFPIEVKNLPETVLIAILV